MALDQLTEQSTADDVKEYAEQVAKEVEAERAGEASGDTGGPSVSSNFSTVKGDAQITSEHANNDDQTPKTPVAKSDETEEAGGSKSWLDDDAKAEAAAYGIEESELADFASREELDRALRLFSKRALAAGQKALTEETGRNEKGQFVKKTEPKAEPKAEEKSKAQDGRYEIKLDKATYDEPLVDELTGIRDHYQARYEELEMRFKALEERFLEADAKAEEDRFDSAIDKFDMPKLFGVTGKETPDELKKREAVMAQVQVLKAGFRTFGRDVEIEALVRQAAPMVFSSEFDKHNLKHRTRKISRQSNGRQGGGATRPQDPREDPRDEADRLYRELAGA